MTFVEDGRPSPDGTEEILTALVAAGASALGIQDPQSAIVLQAFYRPIAEYLATQQQDIAEVLNSSQIDHATGNSLSLLTALIGIRRRAASPATGIARFSRSSPTGTTYTVPSGTTIQTDATDPVKYDTTNTEAIEFYDGFEDGNISEYSGSTGDFSVVTSTVFDGSNSLEGPSASASKIFDDSRRVRVGDTTHVRLYAKTGTISGTLFAVQNANNFYNLVVDESAGEVRLEVTDGGSTSTAGSASVTIPTGEWLEVEWTWNTDHSFDIVLRDSGGTEQLSTTITDSDATFDSGGIGFESQDTADNQYWDNYTQSATGTDIESQSPGEVTNVGANTLIVFGNQPAGVESVTNPAATTGGRDEETDTALRQRAKEELSTGSASTLTALLSSLQNVDEVRTVTIIENDTNSTDGDGRPPHSFEAVVDSPSSVHTDIAQTIVDTKAAGTQSVGGFAGSSTSETVDLINGQTKTITFSKPTEITIYVDCDLTKDSTYTGDDAVRNNIVTYIGGLLSDGTSVGGELGVGDNVIYNQAIEAVMDTQGVHDITNLEVDTSSSPTNTSNISIADTETASADATGSNLDITSSDI